MFPRIRNLYIKSFMKSGKLLAARFFFFELLHYFKMNFNDNPLNMFSRLLLHVFPEMDQKKIVLGGTSYIIPCEITEHKKAFYSCFWVLKEIKNCTGRYKKSDVIRLLLDAKDPEGILMSKRKKWHKESMKQRNFLKYIT